MRRFVREDDRRVVGERPRDGNALLLAAGDEAKAQEILGKVAAENHEDRGMIAQIQGVYLKAGKAEAGQSLLAKVGKEIIELLRKLNKEKNVTIISATHDLKMLDVSDRIIWIRDGLVDKIENRAEINIDIGSLEGEDA